MSTTIVGTKAVLTELAGDYKLVVITAPISSADDAITIAKATHGITYVYAIVGATITYGIDDSFSAIGVAITNTTTLTITSLEADGTPSDTWGDTTVSITVLGK